MITTAHLHNRSANHNGWRLTQLGLMLIVFFWSSMTSAESIVRFELDEYVVSAANEKFTVRVVLDGDSATPEIEPLTDGLFSFGVRVVHDDDAKVDGAADIRAASALDHFGFSPGAFDTFDANSAAVKGNIDQTGTIEPYVGTLLAEFELTNLRSPVSSYTLELESFETLGPTEQVFVDGDGNPLDDTLTFGTATVSVVPEPSAIVPLPYLVIGCLLLRTRRRSARKQSET